jgi:hypothetical protein
MSTVTLTTFAIYKTTRAGGVEHLFGAVDSRRAADGAVELLASSVPLNAASFKDLAPQVGEGLLMLYGRDSLEELHRWRAKARAIGAEFSYAEVDVEVGDIQVGLTDRAMLKNAQPKTRFLNVRRMRAGLRLQIADAFSRYAEGEDNTGSGTRVSQIAMRPDRFGRLFQDDADFGALDVLVIPVADDPDELGKMRSLAYVRPGARVVDIRHAGARIVLPTWMTSPSAARGTRPSSSQRRRRPLMDSAHHFGTGGRT